jgi:DNA-binding transcriptional ArsR family regulator
VVKHVAKLEDARLVVGERDGRRVVYRLTPGPFDDAARWMVDGAASDRRIEKLSQRVRKRR